MVDPTRSPIQLKMPLNVLQPGASRYAMNERRHQYVLHQIRSATREGKPRLVKKLIRKYFSLCEAKVYAALRVLENQRPHPNRPEGKTALQYAIEQEGFDRKVSELAAQIDLFKPCHEPVAWWREPKRTPIACQETTQDRVRATELGVPNFVAGGIRYRKLCDLPSRLKAQHYMIKDVLEAALPQSDFIYDLRGGGRDVLTREVSAAIQSGCREAFTGDVTSSFDSHKPEQLANLLPLPRSVIDNNLITSRLRFRHVRRKEETTDSTRSLPPISSDVLQSEVGPCGSMQGSPTSNIIQAWVFSTICQQAPPGCCLFLFSDNILLLGREVLEVGRAFENLRERFSLSLYGPFHLRGRKTSAEEAFVYLGYEHFYYPPREAIYVEIPRNKLEVLPSRMAAKYRELVDAGDTPEYAKRVVVSGIKGGYKSLTNLEGYIAVLEDWMEQEIERAEGIH